MLIRVKNQFKEDSKTSKTMKEATKEIRNDIADGHEMYTDTKCTSHGLVMMSFVFAPAAGWPIAGVASSYHGPPCHETQLESALGLHCYCKCSTQ